MRSELLLLVFKLGRILRVFKLLKFIDEARGLRSLSVLRFPAEGGAWLQHLCDRERPARLPVPDGGERRLLGDRDHDHRRPRRRGAPDGTGAAAGFGGDAPGFGIIAIPTVILTVSEVRHHPQRSVEVVCSS